MKPYAIQLEISGPTALWTRPDTGSSPVSYIAPENPTSGVATSCVEGSVDFQFSSAFRESWGLVNQVRTSADIQ